jgi:predicted RNA-binding Zn ribbon-like protein
VSRSPRYDVPKAAPQPLRVVQEFVNTVDLENEREWLAQPADLLAWGRERDLIDPAVKSVGAAGLRRAHQVREALRALLRANNLSTPVAEAHEVLATTATRARFTIDFESGTPALVPRARGVDGLLGHILALTFLAMADGSWARLKGCRNCRWAFFDESKNRSARWCSMTLCGNRLKTRAYRRRQRATAALGREKGRRT